MTAPPDLARSEPLAALVVAGALLALLAWLGWRRPTWLFLLALASLAIRPQLLWGGPALGYEWGLHQTLLVLALAANALHFGLRRTVNWPILALLATFGLSLAFGNLHPKLTLPFMLMSLAILALPFVFTQVVLAPGSRRTLALSIALTPLLSVALGGLLQVADIRAVFDYDAWTGNYYRLEGATGNAAVFAMLAFAGFAVALHEWTRPGREYAVYLAVVNLVLVILSGTRMAIFVSLIFVASYAALSQFLWQQLRLRRRQGWAGVGVVVAALLLYGPTLLGRLFENDGETLALSGRGELWTFYLEEFLFSILFGRGFGAGFVAGGFALTTPHNEYLHILVIGGVTGFVILAAAIVLWYRELLRVLSCNDRKFLLALAPALTIYALSDNIFIYSSALALYAYLGVTLTRSSLQQTPLPATTSSNWQPEPSES